MRKYFFIAILFFTVSACYSQTGYQQAIGIKFPLGFGVTYKKFVTEKNNIEAEAVFSGKGFRAAGLYEFNFDIEGVEDVRWFVGPGGHIGFYKNVYKDRYGSTADVGIDGIIGLDYKIQDLPLNVSVDWQPSIVLVGSSGFTPSYGGIGVRYTF